MDKKKYGIHSLDPRFQKDDNSFTDKVSLGNLAINNWEGLTQIITECYNCVKDDNQGNVADYIPQLANVNGDLFGVCVVSVDGQVFSLGDCNTNFCIQSCSKPITYGIALENMTEEEVHNFVGKEPSGRNFNELCLNENNLPHNPLINAGAIMTASLIKPDDPQADRFDYVTSKWKELVAETCLSFSNSVYLSEKDSADRNFCLGYMMQEKGSFLHGKDENIAKKINRQWDLGDLQKNLELYFQLCSIETNLLGAGLVASTLANGGVNPWTEKKVFSYANTQRVLTLMLSCGMYDYSGEWAYKIGIPAKSGVSGIIYAVIPGLLGIACYSPKLDSIGNSFRGIEFFKCLSEKINMHIFDNRHNSEKLSIKNEDILNKRFLGYIYLESVYKNDLQGVNYSLSRGCDINFVDYDQRSALHIAVAEKNLDMVKILIDRGISTEIRDRWGKLSSEDSNITEDIKVYFNSSSTLH